MHMYDTYASHLTNFIWLSSPVRLFADDAITYLAIKNQQDTQQLQDDLHKISEWASNWMMELNTQKCEVIRVSRKRNVANQIYTLNNSVLRVTAASKYLGVTITSDLKWNQHISNICRKANTTLAFLRRNLRINLTELKATAYKVLVRPLVEYCSSIWDPSTNRLIHQIEMIQRRAARFVLNRYHNTSSVTSMLEELGWPTLQKRREDSRLVLMYKLHHNLVSFPVEDFITPLTGSTRTRSQQQGNGYQLPHCRTEHHRQSFFPRTIKAWNALPPSKINASSPKAFRLRLAEGQS